jgi:hypothetical protein
VNAGGDARADEGETPTPRSAADAGAASPTRPREGPRCDLCGHVMRESHCKLICDQCGYTRDCSDP